MDNTELHYVTYDPEAIWDAMTDAYIEAGGEVLYPGDEKEMLLRSVQSTLVQAFAGVDNAMRMQTLRYAIGDYLDLIGENRNCLRIAAQKARVTLSIAFNAVGEAGTLAAGTAFTADGEVFYELEEDLDYSGSAETLTAPALASEAGEKGNGLTTGTALFPQTATAAINSVTAASDATGGTDREADETYRERIRNYDDNGTGTKRGYETLAAGVSAAILDVNAVRVSAGTVKIYLLLADGTTSPEAILAAVTAKLNEDDVRPLTDTVSADLADDLAYTLDVTAVADSAQVSASELQAAAAEYTAWQDYTIGRAFNPDRLIALLYQAGASRVTIANTSTFDGGTAEYTEIGEDERCKGTVNLTVSS